MPKYKVTIVDHVIYDYIVEADTEEAARESARDADKALLKLDPNAGWVEVGDSVCLS